MEFVYLNSPISSCDKNGNYNNYDTFRLEAERGRHKVCSRNAQYYNDMYIDYDNEEEFFLEEEECYF